MPTKKDINLARMAVVMTSIHIITLRKDMSEADTHKAMDACADRIALSIAKYREEITEEVLRSAKETSEKLNGSH